MGNFRIGGFAGCRTNRFFRSSKTDGQAVRSDQINSPVVAMERVLGPIPSPGRNKKIRYKRRLPGALCGNSAREPPGRDPNVPKISCRTNHFEAGVFGSGRRVGWPRPDRHFRVLHAPSPLRKCAPADMRLWFCRLGRRLPTHTLANPGKKPPPGISLFSRAGYGKACQIRKRMSSLIGLWAVQPTPLSAYCNRML